MGGAVLLPAMVVAAAVLLGFGATAASFHPPAPMTAYQRQYMRRLRPMASTASAAATPQLLRAIDSAAFRQHLDACCPQLVGLPADVLLRLIEAEVAVAEITHNFAGLSSHARIFEAHAIIVYQLAIVVHPERC
eukprot:SAG31_NODE_1286_length_9000_cov_2.244692_5_plen_134_part_00